MNFFIITRYYSSFIAPIPSSN